tara:strand:- start:687 stop:962 length:276 start_codon:yes stop_codon:yes gene_type:complete
MRPYKMKHVPTGYYYQPHKFRGSHLSKKGKIYQNRVNGISINTNDEVWVHMHTGTLVYKDLKDKVALTKSSWSSYTFVLVTRKEDWIKEEL